MRIAIASSGLGHVARGVETWARDTAEALHRRGVDVTLFAGGERLQTTDCRLQTIPCWQRGRLAARIAARVSPGFAWRWGLKSTYGWEQLTFWLHLRKRLVDGGFDILHVQDPMLAFWCRRARLAGRVATQEILAHGTEEPPEFLAQFECVQHLAPWHLEATLQSLQSLQRGHSLQALQALQRGHSLQAEHGNRRLQTTDRRPQTTDLDAPAEQSRPFRLSGFPARLLHPRPPARLRQGYGGHASDLRPAYAKATAGMPPTADRWVSIPNFVDTNVFRPVKDDAERAALRRRFGIPTDAFVIGTAAAIKRHHKRIDYLVRELAGYADRPQREAGQSVAAGASRWQANPVSDPAPPPHLVIAGAGTPDTVSLKALAEELAPGRVTFLVNVPHENMADLFRCYDVFALASLFEMMPIALLEAIATGLPCLTNDHPVLAWMAGDGGLRIDMAVEGALAAALECLTLADMARMSGNARARAVEVFSTDVVIGEYVAYYRACGACDAVSP